jgi:hypothetical protein
MKAKTRIDPNAAFPDASPRPTNDDLHRAIGKSSARLIQLFADVQAGEPTVSTTWSFSSRVGWYQQWMLKKRRLLYVVPKRGDVRLSLIVGDKAIDEVKASAVSREFVPVLAAAKRYPEGTGFTFEGESWNRKLVVELLRAKIRH